MPHFCCSLDVHIERKKHTTEKDMFSLWHVRLQLSTYTTSWTPFLSDPSLKPKTNLRRFIFWFVFTLFPISPVRISCPTNLGSFSQKRNQTHRSPPPLYQPVVHPALVKWAATAVEILWALKKFTTWRAVRRWFPMSGCGGFFLETAWWCGKGGTTKPNWVFLFWGAESRFFSKKKKVGGLIWDLGDFCVVSTCFHCFCFWFLGGWLKKKLGEMKDGWVRMRSTLIKMLWFYLRVS